MPACRTCKRILLAVAVGRAARRPAIAVHAAGGGAALGAGARPAAAGPDHGRQPPRLPRLEGAAALRHALRRPRASRWSSLGAGEAAVGAAQGSRAQQRMARASACSTTTRQARPPDAGRAGPGHGRGAASAVPPRSACGTRSSPCRRRRHSARRRAVEICTPGRPQGDDRALVRRPGQRQGHGLADAPRRTRRPARAATRCMLDAAGLQRAGCDGRVVHGHRRRRLDRLRAVPPDRALRAAAAGAVRTRTSSRSTASSRSSAQPSPTIAVACAIGDVKDARARGAR